jgi:quinate dehydrogenase (quinone)
VATPLHVNDCSTAAQTNVIFAPMPTRAGSDGAKRAGKRQLASALPGVGDASRPPLSEPASSISAAACIRRVISTTVDARMIAVDALTGKLCEEFGDHGVVNLRMGMGEIKPGFYFPTAAPTVVRNLVVVGGLVWDNAEVGEPSGVVRAFDVRTGALIWAWDLGNSANTRLPPDGASYSRGTPNVWSTPSFDDALGLIYLPTGNSTPDFWGGHRSQTVEQYSSSIVALDIDTGTERWRFQTVHHISGL